MSLSKLLHFPACLLPIAVMLVAFSSTAHEVRPAYLGITETASNHFEVVWKQPILGDRRLPLEPLLPEACTNQSESLQSERLPENTGAALIRRWQVDCDLRTGLVHIAGLSQTLTDVMVRVDYLSGESRSALLRADTPTFELGDPAPPVAGYLLMGIEHLLFGIDHILFVIGLILFIPNRWMLLKTITAFTVAHSITLALSVTGIVVVSQAAVEAVIALSILFLARELMLPEAERSAVMRVRPWLMAFAFGLLHGFGFAAALSAIGLPEEQMLPALLLFNLGIEIGQLCVIFVVIAAGWLLSKTGSSRAPRLQGAFSWSMTWIIGSLAAYWTIDRIWLVFQPGV